MRSIRTTLLRWLSVGVALVIGAAAALVYTQARDEANELFDYQMQQMAASMPSQPFAPLAGARAFGLDPDEGVVIQIWDRNGLRIYHSHDSPYLPPILQLGFSTINTPRGPWRLYSTQLGATVVQVAQPVSARQQLARKMALRTVLPLGLLLPVLAGLIWASVGRGLLPVRQMTREMGARDAASLDPVATDDLPEEILPFAQSLNDLLARLDRALRAQRDFVADAAHELRTPLAALKLQLTLASRAKTTQEREAALADLQNGVDRASHLVQQLLTLARLEPGREQRPAVVPVELRALASTVIAQRAAVAQARQLDLGLLESESVTVNGDPGSLQVLLGNLVDNAIRYTPTGGTIDVSVRCEPDAAIVEVADTGPGIPESDLQRVFDRFYRAPPGGVTDRDQTGSGLGLAIVQRIAHQHQASVQLSNRKSGGLLVRVRFSLT